MKIFLADTGASLKRALNVLGMDVLRQAYILTSFFYADTFTQSVVIPNCRDFLLDSGAFTFFSSGKTVDWNAYVEEYADFILRNDIKHFFELDIDALIGFKNVLSLREKLEGRTGRKCIPVWHKGRGLEEWRRMCEAYDYVAIGGIASGEISKQQYQFFPALLKEAKERGAAVHGLGFTSVANLKKYRFDTVDSSSWTSGGRFAITYRFDGRNMRQIPRPENARIKDFAAIDAHNFSEWLKFQRYADTHL